MLERLERILVVVADRQAGITAWRTVFGAVTVGDSTSEALNARVATLRAGGLEVEIYEPLGPGPAAAHFKRRGPGLLGVGFASARFPDLGRHLTSSGVAIAREGDRIVLSDQPEGLLAVITAGQSTVEWADAQPRPYEVTLLSSEWQRSTAALARLFALNPAHVVRAPGPTEGAMLFLDPRNRPDRLSVIAPPDSGARATAFLAGGPALFSCAVELDDIAAFATQLNDAGVRHTLLDPAAPDRGLVIDPTSATGVAIRVTTRRAALSLDPPPLTVDLAGTLD